MDHLFAERDFICLAIVRGYMNQTMEWIPPAVMLRFGYANMADFYAKDPTRLSLADIESRRHGLSLSEIRSIIPSGTIYILVDELQTRLAENTEYKVLPFWKIAANTGESPPILRKQSAKLIAYANWAARTSSSLGLPCGVGSLQRNDRIPADAESLYPGNSRLTIFDLRE